MNPKSILIVEDDFLNRRLTRKTLNEMGYEVFEAKNAQIAIDLLKNNSFDLAILDINLGENEQNGISLGQHIQSTSQVPFIYLTAYDNPKIIGEAIRTSPYSYLTKPFKNSDLIAAVEIAMLNGSFKEEEETLLVKDGDFKVDLDIKAINYIESEGNYLLVHTNEKTFSCRSTISRILETLPSDSFIQVHRAFIVNRNKIEKFNSQSVFVNKQALPLSKKYQNEL
ncbi:LytTR family DNA-binding domain-containing protein [Jiulongibacter sediminis]|uniref:LytR/AlgR family response regulator transcription factor n=1 Tax=Jiulongibacter sediminis TaxID=1605367 RepID=UPI0026F02305|nr:response regulator transcription factor [Jiulongibacter sediminis]